MRRRKPRSHFWVYVIWGINGVVVVCLLVASFFYINQQDPLGVVNAAGANTATPRIAQAGISTSFYLPTLTPNPYYTAPVFETSTPFYLSNGQLPGMAGLSLGGRPIEVFTFGEGQFQYLIVAGIHGGSEWNTIELADQLITYINDHPEIVPTDRTLYIIRDMNPDGEARAHNVDGRVNNNGVDLNRNFPTHNWAADWNRDGCWSFRPTTGGAFGGSEPETRAVMNFIATHNIQAIISYHSAALGVFPGGVPWEEPSKRLANMLGNITNYPYPPMDTGCVYTGTLADWAVENGVGAAVDMELANHKDTDFDKNLKVVQGLLSFTP